MVSVTSVLKPSLDEMDQQRENEEGGAVFNVARHPDAAPPTPTRPRKGGGGASSASSAPAPLTGAGWGGGGPPDIAGPRAGKTRQKQ